MNTTETIESRRSIKHFDPNHTMPEADLAELIRLTKLAPSSSNMQNYRLVVIRDKERQKKMELIQLLLNQKKYDSKSW